MKEFTLLKKHLLDEDAKLEVESCVECMMLLKETEKENPGVILSLSTAYLRLPIEEIDADEKETIARVCTNLGKVFESIRMNHLLTNLILETK